MKKRLPLKWITLCLGISVTIQLYRPQDANALMILSCGGTMNAPSEVTLGYILLLPLMILDENKSPEGIYSAAELRNNGYSNANEIALIVRDQISLQSKLQSSHKILAVEKNETRQSLAYGLRSVDPQISTAYIDFVADYNHIQ